MFEHKRSDRDGVVVLALSGGLDASTAPAFKVDVVKLADAEPKKVLVDLSKLTLLDSTGVGVLISLFKRLRTQDGRLAFAGLHGQPREVFKLLRLERALELHDTVDVALERLRE